MKRSKHQAVYKYLPGVWTAFNDNEVIKLNGNSVTIQIDRWNYRPLQNVFTQRITAEILRQIKMFYNRGGNIRGFNLENIENELMYVEPAMLDGIPDIIGDISPLVFYCSNCKSTFSYSDPKFISKKTWQCAKCGKNDIKQLQMIYACECGAAYPVKLPYKTINKSKVEYKYKPVEGRNAYKFFYNSNGQELTEEMRMKCNNCDKYLIPSNASDGKNFRPFDVKTINLIDFRQGNFYKKGTDAQKIIIANYLDIISDDKYEEILDNIDEFFEENDNISDSKEYKDNVNEYMIVLGFEKEEAELMAMRALERNRSNKNKGIQREIEYKLPNLSSEQVEVIASQIIEYNTLKRAKNVISLNDSIENQIDLEVIKNKDEVINLNKKFGINLAQVSQDIEIISSTFAFTRKTKDPEKVQGNTQLALKPFVDNNRNLVYCSSLETEGIVIELDKIKILKWLYKNKIIFDEQMPDIEDKLSIDKWFFENIKADRISLFGDIDKDDPEMKVTYYVYQLIHTISHAMIKSAGILSGLEKNSLSEIILPNLTSLFIYANTTQGLPLGALSGMFEQNYKAFIAQAEDIMGRCIFDPICMDRDDGSCSACTQLSEISCSHFNKDLNRKLLIGHKSQVESIVGFWN